jgi:hypothetical protein
LPPSFDLSSLYLLPFRGDAVRVSMRKRPPESRRGTARATAGTLGGIFPLAQRSKEFEDQVLKHMDMLYAVALRLTP